MRVEVATSEDAEDIARLTESLHQLHCRLAPDVFQPASPQAAIAELSKMLREEDTKALVAWEDGIAIGYCILKIVEREPNAWTCGFRRLLVDQLAVEPDSRRQGVGSRLMESAFEFAREQGIREVFLEYWSNNGTAREFYRALGFVPLTEKVVLTVQPEN